MIDSNAAIVEFLKTDAPLTTKVGTNIYVGRLKDGFNLGPAVVVSTRGGRAELYVPHIRPSVQFKCYGSTQIEAREVYRLIFDALDGIDGVTLVSGRHIANALEEVHGQDLIDPDTNWPFVLSFFEVRLRA